MILDKGSGVRRWHQPAHPLFRLASEVLRLMRVMVESLVRTLPSIWPGGAGSFVVRL